MRETYRLVAVADVLGMKSLLKNRPLSEVAGKVKKMEHAAKERASIDSGGRYALEYRLFSDTVIFLSQPLDNVSEDDRKAYRRIFVSAMSTFVFQSIIFKMPVRVGLAEGLVVVDGDMIVGQPIADADNCEKRQEWIGGILHDSFGEFKRYMGKTPVDTVGYDVPLKSMNGGAVIVDRREALDWVKTLVELSLHDGEKDASECLDLLAEMRENSGSDDRRIQQKYNETMTFLRWREQVLRRTGYYSRLEESRRKLF